MGTTSLGSSLQGRFLGGDVLGTGRGSWVCCGCIAHSGKKGSYGK